MMFFLAGPASVLAEDQTVSTDASAVTSIRSETAVTETETAAPANPAASHQMHEMGGKHKGKGQHGKGGHGGMKHGGGQHGKGMHGKHEQVVKRLDMIEARLAKIEAMLESLVRR
jgi:hypothetical protein